MPALLKGVGFNSRQSCEESQLVETGDIALTCKGSPQTGDACSLIKRQFMVAIPIPMGDADSLHLRILKPDVLCDETGDLLPSGFLWIGGLEEIQSKDVRESGTIGQWMATRIDTGQERLEDDGLEPGAVFKDMIADGNDTARNRNHLQGRATEGILTDIADSAWQLD